jgi:DNA adenine methylase
MPPHTAYIESHLGGGAVLRHKRPAPITIGIDRDPAVIARWRDERLALCTLVAGDAAAYLQAYRYTGSELIYADPPYIPHLRRRARVYRHDYALEDHHRLLKILVEVPCMVMISGYDSDIYNEALKGWRTVTFPAKTHTGVREESVWLNFAPPKRLHDSSHLGDTFRDRQAFRRRHDRLLSRFQKMPEVERHHLLNLLNAEFNQGGLAS